MKYINKANFIKFLDFLKEDYAVYVPRKKSNHRFYSEYEHFSDDIAIAEVRPSDPIKAFFFEATQKVSVDFNRKVPGMDKRPYALVGVKACDLKSLKVQDHVFKTHDYNDPFYTDARNKNLIIACDCSFAVKTCFCLALDTMPYPKENFDIGLSEIDGGFLFEVITKKAMEITDKNECLFVDATSAQIEQRDAIRGKVVNAVKNNIMENNIPEQHFYKGIIEKNYAGDIWEQEAKTCVECGACNTICPTCHCFLLADQKNQESLTRFRYWDSCLLKDFARVAGGANPRKKLWMRLRNRFEKKFDFFPKTANIYACTGCGRCIAACPGKIDIRKILNKLVKNAQQSV